MNAAAKDEDQAAGRAKLSEAQCRAVDLIRQEALGMLQLGRIAAAFLVDKDRLRSTQAELSTMPSHAAKVLHLLGNINHLKLSHELVKLYIRLSVWIMHNPS